MIDLGGERERQRRKGDHLAAGDDGGQDRAGAAAHEDEQVVRRRFLEQLEQAVARLAAHGLHLLDKHHPPLGLKRRIGEGPFQGADLVDLDGRAVRADAQEIRVVAGQPLQAAGADTAGPVVHRLAAEQDRGQVQGHGGLADPVRAGEQVGVGEPVAGQGPADEGERFVLTAHRGEGHGQRKRVCWRWSAGFFAGRGGAGSGSGEMPGSPASANGSGASSAPPLPGR